MQSIILGMLLAGTLVHVSAEDSIDTQIDEIQKAPAEQRVQLMNQLKMKLANMNEEDQIKAMTQMRERLQTRAQKRSSNTAHEAQIRMNQMQQMNQMQHQNMMQTQNLNMNGGAMQGGKR
ncbi:hypothetical protein [Sulfuricurvum sp.]|uniref:hypothetical protein n=1 Tax=Sulfuricurvum sp. TaxID=2025608 RepID=UPI003BB20C74